MTFVKNSSLSFRGIAGVFLFLFFWEILIRFLIQFDNLPAPSAILFSWFDLLTLKQYWEEIAHTLIAAMLGWTVASFAGIFLGLLLGLSKTFYKYTSTSIEVMRPWPGVAFAPIGLLLFGFSLKMELLVIILPALWPVLVNTMGGIVNIPKSLYEVVASLRLTNFAKIYKVFIPSAKASILVGLRISLSLSIIMAVVAEMIGSPNGIGYAIIREQQAMKPTNMFAYIFTIALINVFINYLLSKIVDRLSPGKPTSRLNQKVLVQ